MDPWLSGAGLWGSSNYRLHKWIFENNTDKLDCSVVVLNVFSRFYLFINYFYFILILAAVIQTWSLSYQPARHELIAWEKDELHPQVQIHSQLIVPGLFYLRGWTNFAFQITLLK